MRVLPVILIALGMTLIYSGITNQSPNDLARSILQGKSPTPSLGGGGRDRTAQGGPMPSGPILT
jgi:hypothetical protein